MSKSKSRRYYIHIPGMVYSMGPVTCANIREARRFARLMWWGRENSKRRLPRGSEVYPA